MNNADKIRKQISELLGNIETLKGELNEAKGNEYCSCNKCDKRTKVSGTSVICKHYYVEPYSCNGGAYWSFSEYMVICTKCMNYVRVYKSHDMYSFVMDHLDQFFEVLNWYPQSHDPNLTLEWLRDHQKVA